MTTHSHDRRVGFWLTLTVAILPFLAIQAAQAQDAAQPVPSAAAEQPEPTLPAPADADGKANPKVEIGTEETSPVTPAVPTGPEKIEVKFEGSEQDILTKQAMDKLDVMIESLEFANADLQNVIRIIGERLNINFIFDAGDIDGKVTLRLRNIRLRDALDSILSTRKLAIIADKSGIFRIVSQDRVGRKSVETKTEVIQLNWISAEDLAKTMTPFLTDGSVGRLQANKESNSLIVTDVPPQIEVIRGLIKQLDTPERQVMIEARLVDINMENLRSLGTDWTFAKAGTVTNALADTLIFSDGEGTLNLGKSIGIFGNNYDFNAEFSALESRDVVEVLANPRVSTLNNVPAQISIIQKIPYTEAVSGPSNATTTVEVEFEKAGVDITATPIITPNHYIRMDVKLKQMINRGRVGSDELAPPIIDERNADTTVIVPNKNTVLLGGLRNYQNTEGTDGVPWLHQVPLFGWLFKNKNYDTFKTELVLMMTPQIIEEEVKLTDREKMLYDRIDVNWHLPDTFYDDIPNLQAQDAKMNKRK